MGIETMMIVGLAMSAASTVMGGMAEKDAAQADIDATKRQADLDNERAQEQAMQDKSAAVRKADADMATMIVGMGGAGGINAQRSAVEIGFNEGVNVARSEGNRKRTVQSSRNRMTDANKAGKIRGKSAGINVVSGLGSTAMSGASFFGGK